MNQQGIHGFESALQVIIQFYQEYYMKERVTRMLDQIQLGEVSQADINNFANEIKAAIKSDPSKGKELGQYIAMLGAAFKSQPVKLDMNWVPVNNGHLAIGHKPGGKLPFDGMKNSGASTILTLLQENEDAAKIGAGAKSAGMNWIWFPFSASRPHQEERLNEVSALYADLQQRLGNGEYIYIHCSAGIHRTGMITYGLLRYLGQNALTAQQTLRMLREVTAEQAGEERLVWGDQFEKKQ